MEELVLYELRIPKYNVQLAVASSDVVRTVVYQIHDDYFGSCGSRNWPWKNAFVYKGNEKIGRVSYNGRIWDDNEKQVTF